MGVVGVVNDEKVGNMLILLEVEIEEVLVDEGRDGVDVGGVGVDVGMNELSGGADRP